MKSRHHLLGASILAFIIVIVDQLSKHWALNALGDGEEIPVVGDFITFKLTFNSGAAFSFLDGQTWLFTLISTIVVLGMPLLLRRINHPVIVYSLGAIWGGALGNLIDRLFRDPGFPGGHVVDFINYNGWFIGNVADIALVVGVIVLLLAELLRPSDEQAAQSVADGADSETGEERV